MFRSEAILLTISANSVACNWLTSATNAKVEIIFFIFSPFDEFVLTALAERDPAAYMTTLTTEV
jgi:hypothetical protein